MLLRTGAYSPDELLAEEKKLTTELNGLLNQEAESDASMSEVIREAIKLSELVDDVANVYENAESADREIIIRKMFSELSLTNNTLQFHCKNGLKVLEQRFLTTCDHPHTTPRRHLSMSDQQCEQLACIARCPAVMELRKIAKARFGNGNNISQPPLP